MLSRDSVALREPLDKIDWDLAGSISVAEKVDGEPSCKPILGLDSLEEGSGGRRMSVLDVAHDVARKSLLSMIPINLLEIRSR
jgi:hypothetical protein